MERETLIAGFAEEFGDAPTHEAFSPGRVNLVGDHIDYCGGLVLPMALTMGTYGLFRPNGTSTARIHSLRYGETIEVGLNDLGSRPVGYWSDYVEGVFRHRRDRQLGQGFDLLVDSTIAAGGLSSSASFTTLIAAVAHHVRHGEVISPADIALRLDMAQACQKAETEYVGLSCGIMDQASVLLGGVIKLNCANLTFEAVKAGFGDYQVVIGDTRKPRSLAASKYNERVAETDRALAALAEPFGLRHLAALPLVDLLDALSLMPDAVTEKRLRHVVSEQARVIESADYLASGDMASFGRVMDQSHASLRDDYEVSCGELDTLVSLSQDANGVAGARMTGAGFGGCMVALVRTEAVPYYTDTVGAAYREATGLEAQFSVSDAGEGTWSRPLG